jgi:ATP-dependent RNA helicase RhlB
MLRRIINTVKKSLTGTSKENKEAEAKQPPRFPPKESAKDGSSSRETKPREAYKPSGKNTEQQEGNQASDGPKRRRRRRRPRNPNAEGTSAASSPHAQEPRKTEKKPVPVRDRLIPEGFEGQLAFADLHLPEPIQRALDGHNFKMTTPIQARLLPVALAGRDAAGRAQTGTGKTAAFLIAIFARMLNNPLPEPRKIGVPRALILAPTRELAMQIRHDALEIAEHAGLHTVAVFGGMDFDKQQRELEQVVDLVVATPGRLLDFVNRNVLDLSQIESLVIDEADRMLDMGFIPDVRRIVRMTPHPEKRQTLLFSATLTPEITRLAEQWTRNAETVEIQRDRVAAESIQQKVIITTSDEKFTLLYNILKRDNPERVIIFSNRRDQAEKLNRYLDAYGFACALLTGAVAQEKRVKVLDKFKEGTIRVLVATDVAGRGIHVDGVSHVINYHLPMDPDDYVHRIGRTGRAGDIGTSISFACEMDSFAIPDVEKYLGHALECLHPDEELLVPPPPPEKPIAPPPKRSGAGSGGSRGGPGRGRGPQRGARGGPPRRSRR